MSGPTCRISLFFLIGLPDWAKTFCNTMTSFALAPAIAVINIAKFTLDATFNLANSLILGALNGFNEASDKLFLINRLELGGELKAGISKASVRAALDVTVVGINWNSDVSVKHSARAPLFLH